MALVMRDATNYLLKKNHDTGWKKYIQSFRTTKKQTKKGREFKNYLHYVLFNAVIE